MNPNFKFNFKHPCSVTVGIDESNANQEPVVNAVALPKQAGYPLACYLLERIDDIAPSFAEAFYAGLFVGDIGIFDCPDRYFPAVANAIIEACDTIDSLTPYKDALNKALMADPRFQHKQAA